MSDADKSKRSWRGYLKEYAIIVIGVLTALGAQQAMDWWHWQGEVAAARQAIASEMASNIVSGVRRMRAQNCIDHRLDELAKILDEASVTGRLPPVGFIGAPPVRSYSRGTWEGVVASQTATHFPRDQMVVLGRLYGIPEAASDVARLETEAWSNLGTMTGPGRRLDPAAETELRRSLGLARTYNRTLANIGFQTTRMLQQQGLPYGPDDLAAIAAARDESLTKPVATAANLSPAHVCQPLGPVPAGYGLGMLASTPDFWKAGEAFLPGLPSPTEQARAN